MAEELLVVLKKGDNIGFGFSLLGSAGLPHVIYDIVENSPAAECGEVEAGDVIVKVNGTDVHRFTTKEVLKCLRLSQDPVTLELKRDPKIKTRVRNHLAQSSNPHYSPPPDWDINSTSSTSSSPRISPTNSHHSPKISGRQNNITCHRVTTSEPIQLSRPSRIPTIVRSPVHATTKSCPQSPFGQKTKLSPTLTTSNGTNNSNTATALPSTTTTTTTTNEPNKKARFETYMMTGDLMLNLSRTPQSTGLITTHSKKVDSLCDSLKRNNHRNNGAIAPFAKGESSPSSSPSCSESGDSLNSIKRSIEKDNQNNFVGGVGGGGGGVAMTSPTTTKKPTISEFYNKKQPIINDSDFVIKNDLESGGSSSAGGDFSGDLTNDNSGCVSTSSSYSMMNKKQQHEQQLISNKDNVDNSCSSGSVISNNINDNNLIPKNCEINQYHPNNDHQLQLQYNYHHHNHHKPISSSSSSTVKSENISSPDGCYSVPTSPTSLTTPIIESLSSYKQKESANSVPTSPESSTQDIVIRRNQQQLQQQQQQHQQQLQQQQQQHHNGIVRKCDAAGFRTSRSEDHLQHTQRDILGAVIPIDIDEDVNSSLNTLLDTRQDSEDSQSSCDRDRIVWTYNAPIITTGTTTTATITTTTTSSSSSSSTNSHSRSHSSSISSSPQRSDSPVSPTSVSSSIMSSNSGSKSANNNMYGYNNNYGGGSGIGGNSSGPYHNLACPINGDHSVSEAISNISSPDYQDDDNLLSSRDINGIAISDPSDSDSTLLVSETGRRQHQKHQQNRTNFNNCNNNNYNNYNDNNSNNNNNNNNSSNNNNYNTNNNNNTNNNSNNPDDNNSDHKIVIKVKGPESLSINNQGYSELKDSEDELATLTEDAPTVVLGGNGGDPRESSPPVSDDGSDVDSLHSYHYSPKAVDIPSAVRLAKRLYGLDGFKKSDVSRHLSKNNDFSRVVADEYLKYFDFDKLTLDEALRQFLQQFSLSGETQERERVLVHFSKRYLDCNPDTFNSQDAVHTLTCAIMLLNTDLHGQNIGRKMTCNEFIDNLHELNDGGNFRRDILKQLFLAIKSHPLEWALDDESPDQKSRVENSIQGPPVGPNPFLEIPQNSAAIEYKKGYVMRKCCYDSNYKKSCCGFFSAPFGKRSWKMFYCTLRDLVLYLHKDEHGFRKNQMSDNVHNAIRIHHALATKATDYSKKQHVFRLQTADQSEYLFQTSDSKELQSWVDTINFVCASFSAPPLEGGVGSQKRFQRPLLPSTHTKYLLREQLATHEEQVLKLQGIIARHKYGPIPTKGLPLQNYREKENYLQFELKRYKTYVDILNARMDIAEQQLNDFENSELNEDSTITGTAAAATDPTLTGTTTETPSSVSPLPSNLQNFYSAGGGTVTATSSNFADGGANGNRNGNNGGVINSQQQLQSLNQPSNRYSYRAAIYRSEAQQDLG